jgi:uncharacterized protein YuzE
MQLKFEVLSDVLRVEIRERETAEETREIAERTFAERDKHGVLAILMVMRDSRPIFKVEEYGLSGILQRIAAIPGLRVASVAEDAALHSAHDYVEFLARQRDTALRAFTSEKDALAWLREPR